MGRRGSGNSGIGRSQYATAGCSTGSVDTSLRESPVPAGDWEQAIGYVFTRPEIRKEALTHPSALASEHGHARRGKRPFYRNYERLEFLGDRVLGLIVADLLWHR